MKAIADTGLIVAFGNGRDRHHAWAVELAEKATEPFLTCEPVLAEAAFHLRSVTLVLAMVNEGLLRLDFDVASHLDRIAQLARKYEERRPDLADLCLVRMSELNPRHSLVTVDADFLVYRRNGREVIPVIMPAKR